MATISYTVVERCASGGHTTIDVSFNGGAPKRVTFDTDLMRESLNTIPIPEREETALNILRIFCAGKTRAQLVTALQEPVVVTI
jgi:hypothetical protein